MNAPRRWKLSLAAILAGPLTIAALADDDDRKGCHKHCYARSEAQEHRHHDHDARDDDGARDGALRSPEREQRNREQHDMRRVRLVDRCDCGRMTTTGSSLVAYDDDADGRYDTYKLEDRPAVRIETERQPALRIEERDRDVSERRDPDKEARIEIVTEQPGRERLHEGRLFGRIEDIQSVHIVGMAEPHAIAVIQTKAQGDATVDLGPWSNLGKVGLGKGDTVTVYGYDAKVHGQPAFIATRLQAKDQTVAVERSAIVAPVTAVRTTETRVALPAERVRVSKAEHDRVSGRIAAIATRPCAGYDHEHTLATIRTDDDSLVLIDLGPTKAVTRTANVSAGDEVVVLVEKDRLIDGNLMIADELALNGGDSIVIVRNP